MRNKYQIEIGDQIDVVSTPDGILLKPKPKKSNPKTLTKQLFGIFRKYVTKKGSTDIDIKKATEKGFIEGLNE